MIVTTTDSVPGRKIKEIVGIVSAPAKKYFLDQPLGIRRSKGLTKTLDNLEKEARKIGGEAIVGLRFVGSTASFGGFGVVYGTAVKLE